MDLKIHIPGRKPQELKDTKLEGISIERPQESIWKDATLQLSGEYVNSWLKIDCYYEISIWKDDKEIARARHCKLIGVFTNLDTMLIEIDCQVNL